jgi:hypothetical protein
MYNYFGRYMRYKAYYLGRDRRRGYEKPAKPPWDTPGKPGKGQRNWSAGPLPAERLERHMSPVPLVGVAPASYANIGTARRGAKIETVPSRVRTDKGFDLFD